MRLRLAGLAVLGVLRLGVLGAASAAAGVDAEAEGRVAATALAVEEEAGRTGRDA